MTFTLFGTWQIRILLMTTIGLAFAIAVAFKSSPTVAAYPLITLLYLAVFGIGWDLLYHQLQRFRLDGDWKCLLQLLGAMGEGIFLILMVKTIGLPGLDRDISISWDFGGFTPSSAWPILFASSILTVAIALLSVSGGTIFINLQQ